MKKIFFLTSTLLISSLVAAAADGENILSIIIPELVTGSGPIKRELNLSDREGPTGKSFAELRAEAHNKGVPWLLIPQLRVSSSGFGLTYLDGFNFLNRFRSGHLSEHDVISNTILIVYPGETNASAGYKRAKVVGEYIDEVDSIERLYFNNDKDALTELAIIYIHYYKQKPATIKTTKRVRFWVSKALEKEGEGSLLARMYYGDHLKQINKIIPYLEKLSELERISK